MIGLNHLVITIVRHGQTVANKTKTIQGQSDTKLSDEGIKQSEELAQHLDCSHYNLVYSSDLSRALDTCKILVKNQIKIITDIRLRERKFGPIEGQSLDHLKQMAQESGCKLTEYTPKGGETLSEVRDRVKSFINDQLVNEVDNGFNVLIVTHGGVIREIMKYFKEELDCDFKSSDPYKITPNTSLNQFELVYDGKDRKIQSVHCLKVHDITHLSGQSRASALNEEQVNDRPSDNTHEAL